MIIGVLADTHGHTEGVLRQLRQQKIDCLLFAGDFYNDGQKISGSLKIKHYSVLGNCDRSFKGAKTEEFIEILGHKFYLTHGHQWGVKKGVNRLYYRALELGADAVVYGHTHVPHLKQEGDIWMINPGSPTRPRFGSPGTFGLIEVEQDVLKPRLIGI